MLHGWGASLKLMQPLGERLAALGYTVYIPDLPGFGESDPPPAAWGVTDYANFVVAYLDAHQLEQVYLFGHSFGGRLGLVLGAEYAGSLRQDGAGGRGRRADEEIAAGANSPDAYKAIRDGLYKVGAKSLADNLRAALQRALWLGGFSGGAAASCARPSSRSSTRICAPMRARVKLSTLLFWGDKDEDTPLWQGRELETLIPDAGLIVYEGAGHYSYLERLSETVKTVDYFFKQESTLSGNRGVTAYATLLASRYCAESL